MGRPKGRKSGYKFWTAKEKYDLILPIIGIRITMDLIRSMLFQG